jgi:RsiW-degrading membrane proteinase PrsW (M82 family)
MLLGLFAFVGLAFLVEQALSLDDPISLAPPVALAMALMPALLWLGYFYSQDRWEPEPKHFVFGVFLLGAFVAAPVSDFIIEMVLDRSGEGGSLSLFSAERWIAAVAVIGIGQEICKYAVVRYTMYSSPEFDEPLDGIIYATAAGIGFATHQSYEFLQGRGGEVLLSAGAAQTVIATLAHASFAGILGYTLGRAKFGAMGAAARGATLATGLVVAATLNGCFFLLVEGLGAQGLDTSPWRRILASFGFAALVLLITSLLMRRLIAISPHHPDDGASPEEPA